MKTKDELDVLKKEVETLNNKLEESTEEELNQVFGGIAEKISTGGWCNYDGEVLVDMNNTRSGFTPIA